MINLKKISIITTLIILITGFAFIIEEKSDVKTLETSAQSLSTKKIGWGIKKNDNHEQPDLGKINKEIIEKNNGIAMGNSNDKYIYLTFDEGYEAGYTKQILSTLKSPGNSGFIKYTTIIVIIDITNVINIEFPVIFLAFSVLFSPIVFESNAVLEIFKAIILICIISIITPAAPIAPTALVPSLVTTIVSTNVINVFIKYSKAIGIDIFSCFFTVNSSFIFLYPILFFIIYFTNYLLY